MPGRLVPPVASVSSPGSLGGVGVWEWEVPVRVGVGVSTLLGPEGTGTFVVSGLLQGTFAVLAGLVGVVGVCGLIWLSYRVGSRSSVRGVFALGAGGWGLVVWWWPGLVPSVF